MDVLLKNITDLAAHRTACLVLPVCEDGELPAGTAAVDRIMNRRLARLLKAEHFGAAAGKSLLLHHPAGVAAERVLLVGAGKAGGLDAGGFRKLVAHAFDALRGTGATEAVFALLDVAVKERDTTWMLEQIGTLSQTTSYRYARTLGKPEPAARLQRIVVAGSGTVSRAHARTLREAQAIGRGINRARELGNLPANICTPSFLAAEARALARRSKTLRCRVLDEKQMRALGMGALLSVTAGTREPARLIVLEYHGGARAARPHVLVGKGITFDTGGISLKPGAAMDEMKFDMCGAASVIGSMAAIAEIAPKLNVIGIVAACENMPGGSATRPGDVVRSMAGTTIEILNTDAEGRLILCDALTYAARFNPASLIDIATLTGACVVALGKHASGLFSNSEELAAQLLEAGSHAHDRAWQMPLWEDYQEQLKSNFADVANIGGPQAGSVTAACFLARFTRTQRWAHLDIAGTAWDSGAAKGATGRPVGLLVNYLLARAGSRG